MFMFMLIFIYVNACSLVNMIVTNSFEELLYQLD